MGAPYDYELPTWYAYADAVGFDGSGNKHFFSLYNGSGSGKIIKVHGLYLINLQLTTVTGVGVRFEIKRIASLSGGSAIIARPADTRNTDLPSQISIATGPSVDEGHFLWSFSINNDEILTDSAFSTALMNSNLVKRPETYLQPFILLQQQGITLKQITSTAVGQCGVLCVFTID